MAHPLVGVWSIEIDWADKPHLEYVTHTYHPEGSMAIAASTYAAHGAWIATGERSASVTALLPIPPGGGSAGWLTMRAEVQLSPDGGTFQMEAIESRPTPSGVAAERRARLSGKRFLAGS